MLLYVLSAFVTLFKDVAFIIKGNANNGRNPSYYPFPVLMIPFPDKAFINEKATGCVYGKVVIEAAIAAFIVPRSLPSLFLFHVLLFQLHHRLIDRIFPSDLNILMILSISSFAINKSQSFS